MINSVARWWNARVFSRRGATGRLALAASPTFAAMAWITASDPSPLTLCSAGLGMSPISGMPAMYLLMSLFHLPPWLKLCGFSTRS